MLEAEHRRLVFDPVPTPNLKDEAHGPYAVRGGNLEWPTLPQSL
jgi:hypothetical protein